MSDPKPTAPANPPAPVKTYTQAELDAAVAAAKTEAAAAAKKEGAVAEQARIKAIREVTIPGHEALAEKAIADFSTPENFAMAQAQAEKGRGAEYINQRREAEAKLAAVAPKAGTDPQPQPKADKDSLPETDEQAKKAYADSVELQKEFRSEGAYLGWVRAARNGQAKILKGRAA